MELKEVTDETRSHMQKSIDHADGQLAKIRTGRASTSLLDEVKVNAYGAPIPINQTANVSAPDARTLIIQPWDKSLLSEIEKAIQSADLGFNPQNDGDIIRINIPPLTEERRKELVKQSKKEIEDAKVAIRNIRRDANDKLKKAEKDKELSEDFRKQGEGEVQGITDGFIKKLDDKFTAKEKELLSE